MNKDNLGNRMKSYEGVSRTHLTRRLPVIIRLDGKAFHTFTRGFKKPFDDVLIQTMQETAKYLCENIQGCKIAYTQSDEISLLLTDYEKINTCAWFDNNIQKMVSVSASMATLAFNRLFREAVSRLGHILGCEGIDKEELSRYFDTLESRLDKAIFDSRIFTIPKEEVNNYFIWRQQDCVRNSIQMVGQSNFSHKELHKKNCDEIQEMLYQKRAINWSDLPIFQKRGSCIVKDQVEKNGVMRSVWEVDKEIPTFTKDRDYINKLV